MATCLASTGRVTWAGDTTFSHVNRSDRSPGTRQQLENLIACARMRSPCTFALYLQLNIPKEERQNFGGWYILLAFALKSFSAPKSSLQSTDTVDFNKTAFYSNYKLLLR